MTTVLEGVYESLVDNVAQLLPSVWEMVPSEPVEEFAQQVAGEQYVGWTIGSIQLLIGVDEESAAFLTKESNLSKALEPGVLAIMPTFGYLVEGVDKLEFPTMGEESVDTFTSHEGTKMVTYLTDAETYRATVAISITPAPELDADFDARFPEGLFPQHEEEEDSEIASTRIEDEGAPAGDGPSSKMASTAPDTGPGQDNTVSGDVPPMADMGGGMAAPGGQSLDQQYAHQPGNYGMPPQQPGFSTPLVSPPKPAAARARQSGGPRMSQDAIASPAEFSSFDDYGQMQGQPHPMALLGDVEMGVTAELGRTRLTVKDILALIPGSIIELDRAAGAPVDVVVNGTLIARGEVVVIDEEFGIRISQIVGVHDVVASQAQGDQE